MKGASSLKSLLVVTCLHFMAIYLFSSGYLLSKRELKERSQCNDAASIVNVSDGCWSTMSYDKVVAVVIDGLRFDAVVDEHCRQDQPLYVAKFPKLMQLIQHGQVSGIPFCDGVNADDRQGEASRVFKFIADPPTGTMQRLKGILTGSLPTLIDVSNSFSGKAVTEDNLLWQLKQQGKKLAAVGDDTWDALFHDELDISKPYDSFNVEDLDTVDDAVLNEFYPLVLKSPNLWDFAVGHYLGVDHASHMFAVDSVKVAEKLTQMDDEVTTFVQQLLVLGDLPRTLFLLFGDHGMKLSGEHAGGSQEEIETVLIAIDIQHLNKSLTENTLNTSYRCEDLTIHRMNQIDLAPTLAFLTGVAIPYGNLGTASVEMLKLGGMTNEDELASMLRLNAWQVNRYLNSYAKVIRGAFAAKIDALNRLYLKSLSSESDLKEVNAYLKEAIAFARLHWTQFDDVSIVLGIVTFTATFIFQLYLTKDLVDKKTLGHIVIVILHGFSYFSNSFIEAEATVTHYILSAFLLLLIREKLLSQPSLAEAFPCVSGIFLSNVVISYLGGADGHGSGESWLIGLRYVALPSVLVTLCTMYWQASRINPMLGQRRQRLLRSGLLSLCAFQLCLIAVYWIIEDLSLALASCQNLLARGVYVVSLVSILSVVTGLYEAQTLLFCLSASILPPVLLISGKMTSVVMMTAIWQLLCSSRLVVDLFKRPGNLLAILGHYTVLQIFFSTGHYCELSGLHFTAGFIGFSEFHYYAAACLLVLETFAAFFLVPLFIGMLLSEDIAKQALLLYQTLRSHHFLQSMLSANLLRRHLWTIKTFAPKFVFELCFVIVTDLWVVSIVFVLSRKAKGALKRS